MKPWYGLLFALALLTGCVPARVPSHLDDTPGPPVQISESWFETTHFAGHYPAGWRTITSPAGEPPFLIFVAPDNCALIQVSAEIERAAPDPNGTCEGAFQRVDTQTVIGATTVYLSGIAPENVWTDFEAAFEQVQQSITTRRPQ